MNDGIDRRDQVPLCDLDDVALQARLQQLGIRLRSEEARTLCQTLERDPTRSELALLQSMWSEHCSYKSSRALLGRLPTSAPNVVLGPGADAGIVRLPRVGVDGRAVLADCAAGAPATCIALGHESHNHPSQLLPVEGAATGIGGIVRDVYCMGADVIGVLDALRFGDPSSERSELARQIARGVVHGITSYGNALGVPNLGGDVEFDPAFDDNCLVNVVALGVLQEDELIPSVVPHAAATTPYVLLLVGKPTDDSGLGGAAFASGVLDTDERTQERGAVQLPDPFFKRVLTEANKVAVRHLRAHGAPFAIKDLGAAGLGGAASEMAAGAGLGLDLDLDLLHRVHPDETAAVLLVAETQERYAFAVPATVADDLVHIYEQDFQLGSMVRGAGARVVGRFTAEPRFRARRDGRLHVDLTSRLITQPPQIAWQTTRRQPRSVPEIDPRSSLPARDVAADLRTLLASTAAASRHWLFQHYDSDVQGRTALRPGDADAGVLVLDVAGPLGIAIAVGGSARWGRRDAWRAGAAAVCEAARNVAATGATPWALTDCLNYGSPESPQTMQDLEDGVEGLAAAARTLGLRGQPGAPLPFVSGNVSLYNETRSGRAIPPSPIAACLGVLCDVGRARGVRLKAAGDLLYRIGRESDALGASLYAQATGQGELFVHDALPPLDLDVERAQLHAVLEAFDAGLVQAGHDLGDGGLLLALLEMSFARSGAPTLGVRCALPFSPAPLAARVFSEATGFLCEVRPDDAARFESICAGHGVSATAIGAVQEALQLQLEIAGEIQLALDLQPLERLWREGLRAVFDEGSPM